MPPFAATSCAKLPDDGQGWERRCFDALNDDYEKIKKIDQDQEKSPEGAQLAATTLDRLEKANEALNNTRSSLEDRADALEDLHRRADGAGTRLAELVDEANRLLCDAEAIPTKFDSTAAEMREEISVARNILATAPTAADEHAHSLSSTVDAAQALLPVLDDRNTYWNEFVAARDAADQLLEEVRRPLDALTAKPPCSLDEARGDLEDAKRAKEENLERLKDAVREMQRLSELLDPLESAYADVRFLDADVDQTAAHYDDLLTELHAEIEDEAVCDDSAKQLNNELSRLLADIPQINDPQSLAHRRTTNSSTQRSNGFVEGKARKSRRHSSARRSRHSPLCAAIGREDR
ncbi:unnamed protein product, partial [Mesorhabditis belari]|uniref:Nuclear anchorage protein 1 spectrin-like repeat domain-containing protein n=1 Tax=Mesorhabditis belari TaxID=2138241 RepID=A0AAF3EA84_9BILA